MSWMEPMACLVLSNFSVPLLSNICDLLHDAITLTYFKNMKTFVGKLNPLPVTMQAKPFTIPWSLYDFTTSLKMTILQGQQAFFFLAFYHCRVLNAIGSLNVTGTLTCKELTYLLLK